MADAVNRVVQRLRKCFLEHLKGNDGFSEMFLRRVTTEMFLQRVTKRGNVGPALFNEVKSQFDRRIGVLSEWVLTKSLWKGNNNFHEPDILQLAVEETWDHDEIHATKVAYKLIIEYRPESKEEMLSDKIVAMYVGRVLRDIKNIKEDNGNLYYIPENGGEMPYLFLSGKIKKKIESDWRKLSPDFVGIDIRNKKHIKCFYSAIWNLIKERKGLSDRSIQMKFITELEEKTKQRIRVYFRDIRGGRCDEQDFILLPTLESMKNYVMEHQSEKFGGNIFTRFHQIDLYVDTQSGRRKIIETDEEWKKISYHDTLSVQKQTIKIRWNGGAEFEVPLMKFDYLRTFIGDKFKVDLEKRTNITFKLHGSTVNRRTFSEGICKGETLDAYPDSIMQNSSIAVSEVNSTPNPNLISQRGYDDLSDQKKCQVALMELVDNALPPMISSKCEECVVRIRFHKHKRKTTGETMHSVSITNPGTGMNQSQLENYWKYRNSQADRKAKDENPAETQSFFFVDGRLNFFGEGAKLAIFAIARGAIVTSRIHGQSNVGTSSCSKDLERWKNEKRDTSKFFMFPYIGRTAGKNDVKQGSNKISAHHIKDPMFEEYWDSELFRDIVDEELQEHMKEFTRVILYDIHEDLIPYFKDHLPQLRCELANTYHYYLHANKHLKTFVKPNEDQLHLPQNCFFDSDTRKFKEIDIEIIGFDEKKETNLMKHDNFSLKKIETPLFKLHEESKKEMYFRLYNGMMGIVLYTPFLKGRETNPTYMEGFEIKSTKECFNKCRGKYKEKFTFSNNSSISSDDMEIEEGGSRVFYNVEDENVVMKSVVIHKKDKELYQWVCMDSREEKKYFWSKEYSKELFKLPHALRKDTWKNDNGNSDCQYLDLKYFKGPGTKAVQWFWQGRRLINATCSYKDILHFDHKHYDKIREDRLDRVTYLMFSGEKFNPHQNKLKLADIGGESILKHVSNSEGRRVYLEKGPRQFSQENGRQKQSLKKEIRDFIEECSKLDMPIRLLKQGRRPKYDQQNQQKTHMFTMALLSGNKEKFEAEDIVGYKGATNAWEYAEIKEFIVKQNDMAVQGLNFETSQNYYLASEAKVKCYCLPKPERRNVSPKEKELDIFKVKLVERRNKKIDAFKLKKKIKMHYPKLIKFEGIDEKNEPVPMKVSPFPWKSDRSTEADFPKSQHGEHTTWKVGTKNQYGGYIFSELQPRVYGFDDKQIRDHCVRLRIFQLDKEGADASEPYLFGEHDFKLLGNAKNARCVDLKPKEMEPGRYSAQFIYGEDESEEPWDPILYEAHFQIEPGEPHSIVLAESDGGQDLQSRLGVKCDHEISFHIEDQNHNKLKFKRIKSFTRKFKVRCTDERIQVSARFKKCNNNDLDFSCVLEDIRPQKDRDISELLQNDRRVHLELSHNNYDFNKSLTLNVLPGHPTRWKQHREAEIKIQNNFNLKSPKCSILKKLVRRKGHFVDDFRYKTYDPDYNCHLKYETESGEWKALCGQDFDTEKDFLTQIDPKKMIEIFQGGLNTQVFLTWDNKEGKVPINITPHGKPASIHVEVLDSVQVGSEPAKLSISIFTDEGNAWKHRMRSELNVLVDGHRKEAEKSADGQSYEVKINIPEKIPKQENGIEIKAEFKCAGVKTLEYYKIINLEPGHPYQWRREDGKNITWECGLSKKSETFQLYDQFGNRLEPPRSSKVRLVQVQDQEEVKSQTMKKSKKKSKLVINTKGLKPAEYKLFVEIPRHGSSSIDDTEFGVNIIPGQPKKLIANPDHIDLSRTEESCSEIEIEAQLRDGEGNQCFARNGMKAILSYQPEKTIQRDVKGGKAVFRIKRSDLTRSYQGFVQCQGRKAKIEVKIPRSPDPIPEQWRDVQPSRKTDGSHRPPPNEREGYCGVLNDYIVLRIRDVNIDSKKLQQMLSIRLRKYLNLAVVSGDHSKAGKWFKRKDFAFWDFKWNPKKATSSQRDSVLSFVHVLEKEERTAEFTKNGPSAAVVKNFLNDHGGRNLVAKDRDAAHQIRNRIPKGKLLKNDIWMYDPIDEITASGVNSSCNHWRRQEPKTIIQMQERTSPRPPRPSLGRDGEPLLVSNPASNRKRSENPRVDETSSSKRART